MGATVKIIASRSWLLDLNVDSIPFELRKATTTLLRLPSKGEKREIRQEVTDPLPLLAALAD